MCLLYANCWAGWQDHQNEEDIFILEQSSPCSGGKQRTCADCATQLGKRCPLGIGGGEAPGGYDGVSFLALTTLSSAWLHLSLWGFGAFSLDG
jgi:hypothetical protein